MTDHQAQAAYPALPGDTIARKIAPMTPLKVQAVQACPHHKRPNPGHLAYEVKTVNNGRTWLCALTVTGYIPI